VSGGRTAAVAVVVDFVGRRVVVAPVENRVAVALVVVVVVVVGRNVVVVVVFDRKADGYTPLVADSSTREQDGRDDRTGSLWVCTSIEAVAGETVVIDKAVVGTDVADTAVVDTTTVVGIAVVVTVEVFVRGSTEVVEWCCRDTWYAVVGIGMWVVV
jgi:hypothetical protein